MAGNSPLMDAANEGQLEAVQQFLQTVDVNYANKVNVRLLLQGHMVLRDAIGLLCDRVGVLVPTSVCFLSSVVAQRAAQQACSGLPGVPLCVSKCNDSVCPLD